MRLAVKPMIRPRKVPNVHCHSMVNNAQSLTARPADDWMAACRPMYKKGKETPSLQPDSQESMSFILFGT